MKRVLVFTAALVLLIAFSGPAGNVSARAMQVDPVNFTSNGDNIAGWHWLRSAGHTATWTFRTSDFQGVSKIYINFAPLVTNGASGGSGFSTSCRVTVEGGSTINTTIPLSNAFMPQDPADSGGLGYMAYGHSGAIMASVYAGVSELKITIAYPFASGRHVAVNRGALHIGFSR